MDGLNAQHNNPIICLMLLGWCRYYHKVTTQPTFLLSVVETQHSTRVQVPFGQVYYKLYQRYYTEDLKMVNK